MDFFLRDCFRSRSSLSLHKPHTVGRSSTRGALLAGTRLAGSGKTDSCNAHHCVTRKREREGGQALTCVTHRYGTPAMPHARALTHSHGSTDTVARHRFLRGSSFFFQRKGKIKSTHRIRNDADVPTSGALPRLPLTGVGGGLLPAGPRDERKNEKTNVRNTTHGFRARNWATSRRGKNSTHYFRRKSGRWLWFRERLEEHTRTDDCF